MLKILGAVVSPESVRAMITARLFKMLGVFVTLVSVSSLATLSLGAVSVNSTQTVLASRNKQIYSITHSILTIQKQPRCMFL